MARSHGWLILIGAVACGTTEDPKDAVDSDTGTGPVITDTFPEETDEPGGGSGGPTFTPGGDTDTDLPEPVCEEPTDTKLTSACDLSANTGQAIVRATDGPLVLSVSANDTPSAGTFNGRGTGNVAIAGFHGFSRKALTTRTTVSLDAKAVNDALAPELRLIVALGGCSANDAVQLVVKLGDMAASVGPNGTTTYTVDATSLAWFGFTRINGTDGVLLWGRDDLPTDGAEPKPLADLLAAHPDACLRNINNVAFLDMPKGDVISSSLLVLGDALDPRGEARWEIHRAAFGDVEFVR